MTNTKRKFLNFIVTLGHVFKFILLMGIDINVFYLYH